MNPIPRTDFSAIKPDQDIPPKKKLLDTDAMFKAMIKEATMPNPFNPEDKFDIGKIANLAAINQSETQTHVLQELIGLQKEALNSVYASSYLGKSVIIEENGRFINGSVEAINLTNKGVESVVVNGRSYGLESIRQLQSAPVAPAV